MKESALPLAKRPTKSGDRWGPRKARNRSGSPARAESSTRQEVQIGLGIRITALRRIKGWPQDVLARKCGISPSTLGQIERGHQDFHMLSLVRIAKGLQTTVADLLMGIG